MNNAQNNNSTNEKNPVNNQNTTVPNNGNMTNFVNKSNISTNNNVTNQNINTNGQVNNTSNLGVQSSNNISNNNQNIPITASPNIDVSNNINRDNGAIVNENLKKVEVNYTPPSKAKTVSMILIFVLIIGFVIFLPEITSMINIYKAKKNEEKNEVITTGRLECTLKSNTSTLDMDYLRVFNYTDSKLESADYTVTTKGDVELDEEAIKKLATQCDLLKDYTSNLEGINVSCTSSPGKLVERQSFKFANIDSEKIDAAFAEVGGTYPSFRNEQLIDEVEQSMNAAGYTCIRK